MVANKYYLKCKVHLNLKSSCMPGSRILEAMTEPGYHPWAPQAAVWEGRSFGSSETQLPMSGEEFPAPTNNPQQGNSQGV